MENFRLINSECEKSGWYRLCPSTPLFPFTRRRDSGQDCIEFCCDDRTCVAPAVSNWVSAAPSKCVGRYTMALRMWKTEEKKVAPTCIQEQHLSPKRLIVVLRDQWNEECPTSIEGLQILMPWRAFCAYIIANTRCYLSAINIFILLIRTNDLSSNRRKTGATAIRSSL